MDCTCTVFRSGRSGTLWVRFDRQGTPAGIRWGLSDCYSLLELLYWGIHHACSGRALSLCHHGHAVHTGTCCAHTYALAIHAFIAGNPCWCRLYERHTKLAAKLVKKQYSSSTGISDCTGSTTAALPACQYSNFPVISRDSNFPCMPVYYRLGRAL